MQEFRPSPFSRRQPSSSSGRLTPVGSQGVKSYEVSLEQQSATIVATPGLSYDKVLQTIAKTGKKVNSGEADGETRSVEIPPAA